MFIYTLRCNITRRILLNHMEIKIFLKVLLNSLEIRAQLFKTNNVVSQCIVKSLISKYGIYATIFAEKKCE